MLNPDLSKFVITLAKYKALLEDQQQIMKTASQFRAFYEDDFNLIKNIIKEEILDKQFSSETVNKLRIQHLNIINKPLTRKVSGIYTKDPKRFIKYPEEHIKDESGNIKTTESEKSKAQNELLMKVLEEFDFSVKVKQALEISEFFNIALAMPVFREREDKTNQYSIDILLPDEYVPVSEKDYLLLDKISILRLDEKKEFYWLVYTQSENYTVDMINNESDIAGRKKGDRENVYGIIPIAILRKKVAGDFYGQPNWNLYNSQLEADISLTDLRFSETFQHFGIYWGINTNLASNTAFSPNQFIDFKQEDPNLPRPELNCLTPQTDFKSLRDNIDWRIDKAQNLEGIPSSSTSREVQGGLSGDAKEIDEGELNENRENVIARAYKFEKELIKLCIIVWNYHNDTGKKIDLKDGEIYVEFQPSKPHESISDKKARREMEKADYIKTPIDFIMQDDEISREEAEQRYAENKLFYEQNSPKTNSQKTVDELLGTAEAK